MRVEPHRLSQQRVEDAVEPVFPAGGSQLEVEVFASLLPEGVSNKLGGCPVVAGLAFQMDDTRAVQEDVVVAMQHEAALHLRLFEIHEESRVEGTTFLNELTAHKEVGSCHVVHFHPVLRIEGRRLFVQVQGFEKRYPEQLLQVVLHVGEMPV